MAEGWKIVRRAGEKIPAASGWKIKRRANVDPAIEAAAASAREAPQKIQPTTDLRALLGNAGFAAPMAQAIVNDPRGAGANLFQGILAGGADEVAGAYAADPTRGMNIGGLPILGLGMIATGNEDALGPGYAKARDNFRATEDRFASENPATAFGLNLAGSALTGAGVAKALPWFSSATTTGGNIARGSVGGLSGGATAGYLSADGEDRGMSAVIGGGLGGIIGWLAPAIAGTIRGLSGSRPAPVAGLSREEVAAADSVGRAIERDGTTPQALLATVDRNAGSGKPLNLADMGGENLRGTLDTVVNRPGPAREMAREAFRKRQTGLTGDLGDTSQAAKSQSERLSGDVAANISDREFFDTIDTITEARAKAGAPLYKKAYEDADAMGGLTSPQIVGILSTPSGQDALRRAARLAADEQNTSVASILEGLTSEGLQKGQRLPMQLLDYVKRGLDDQVAALKREGGAGTNAFRIANGNRVSFRNELVNLNPAYGDALDAWSGMSAAKDAVEGGKDAFAKSVQPEQLRAQFSRLSDQEKEFFLIGVARHFQEKLASVPQATNNASIRLLTGTDAAKLRSILPPEKLRKFLTAIEQEQRMFSTAGVMGNSATARRLASDADLADNIDSFLADKVTGNRGLRDVALDALRWVRERGTAMGNENARTRIAEMLLSEDPNAQRRALEAVKQIMSRSAETKAGRGTRAIGQGYVLGSSVGSLIGGL